jgi:protein tyrosine/serine phosphatase
LTAEQSTNLIGIMKEAAKPILIHCQGGADRSGLASALYLAAVKKAGRATAERQISIRYGHFSLPFIAEYAMDRTLEAFEGSLGSQHPGVPDVVPNQSRPER